MSDMTVDTFLEYKSGRIALSKIKDSVSDGFRFYEVESIQGTDAIKYTGCEFRLAKSGKNKGKLCVMVDGTKKIVFVTRAELESSSC